MAFKILDPSASDKLGSYRGGGRIVQILHENLENEATFISSIKDISAEDTVLVTSWTPFEPPKLSKRVAKKQMLMIFDVIPLKHPQYFPPGIKGKLNFIRNNHILKHFDTVITISSEAAQDIEQFLHVPADHIEVVYPTTRKLFFETTKKIDTNKKDIEIPNNPYCLYVGDMNWNKNIVNIARAAKTADLKCVFVGKPFEEENQYNVRMVDMPHPELKEFHEFTKIVHNNDHFIFPGYVSDENLIALYQNAVCNVLASRDEGFGLSYLEASTQKCPSVLSDISIFNEIAENAALFADPKDPRSIAEKLVRFKTDKELRSEQAQKAFTQSKKFTPNIFKERLLSLL